MFPFVQIANMGAESDMFLTKEERLFSRIQLEIESHIESNGRSLEDEHNLIKEKKSALSRRCREFIISYFNK